MEPLNDHDLQSLLRTWKAPAAPEHLQPPLPRRRWYAVLWATSVRIPVPVLALILMAIIALQVLPRRERAHIPPDALREVRLSDFEPVPEAHPVVVRRTHYENR
jgi:hypothetical protein